MTQILTDANFDKELSSTDKFVLVDFFATWCEPCTMLAPIIEKAVEGFENVILAKVNVDQAPVASQKHSIDRIPAVILFKNSQPVDGFIGVMSEEMIKKWLKEKTKTDDWPKIKAKKAEELLKESDEYAKKSGFQLNPDKKNVDRVINGLIENEKKNGAKYCPCRRITGNKEEDAQKICPCIWHKDEIAKDGKCFCGLFTK